MKYILLMVLFAFSYCTAVVERSNYDMNYVNENLSDSILFDNFLHKYPEKIDKLTYRLARQDTERPMFDMRFQGFCVANVDPYIANATEEQKIRAKTFTIKEKQYMLRTLDYIRFIINTPEFETAVLNTSLYSSRSATGPWGTIKFGEKLDSARILEVLRFASYKLIIVKRPLRYPVIAVATLGPSYYVSDLTKMNKNRQLWIGFPSHQHLDQGKYLDGTYHANAFFHEMLHNLGFNHKSGIPGANVPYGLGSVLQRVANDSEFRAKYGTELAGFRPFYEEIYKEHYIEDTKAIQTRSARGFSEQISDEDLIYDAYEDVYIPPHQ